MNFIFNSDYLFGNFFRLLLIASIMVACACENPKSAIAQENSSAPTSEVGRAPAQGLPFIGFNAKGDLNTPQQVAMADSLLSKLPTKVKSKLVIRVAGGTRSQRTFIDDWTDEKVSLWANLQKKHGIHLGYTVNGNDTPINQVRVIQKFTDAGAQFDFLEMMTEYYLPKFRLGKTDRPEVTEAVTVESYLDDILPRFWKELDALELPYYLIYAPLKPHGSDKQQEYNTNWNRVMNEALNGRYSDRDLHAVLHLYKQGPQPYDYDQINRLREALPQGRHIAVTEAGVIDKELTYAQIAPQIREHYTEIFKRLGAGDFLLDQVLYSDYAKDNTATLNSHFADQGGLTPKGAMVVKFIRDHYE